MIVKSDANTQLEDAAYGELATTYRNIGQQVQRGAERMAACRDLPMPAHDEAAFGAEQLGAFERYVAHKTRCSRS
jgi:hypothetical protein